jgi:hypothetical protein
LRFMGDAHEVEEYFGYWMLLKCWKLWEMRGRRARHMASLNLPTSLPLSSYIWL